jgi:hypothetical protein
MVHIKELYAFESGYPHNKESLYILLLEEKEYKLCNVRFTQFHTKKHNQVSI